MQSRFATTSWTQVLAAREGDASPESRRALETLCASYWYPLYVFVRRQGHDADAARDITQSYFAELLEKGYLEDYDPSRGRFRVFLRTSVRNFMSKERARAATIRRGGPLHLVSLDSDALEDRYRREPADPVTPEEIFERRWTLELLDRVLGRLRQEQQEIGSEKQFARLEAFLTGDGSEGRYQDVAAHLGTSEGAVKTAVHRLRKRFGQLLRAEVAETVADPNDIDDEVKHLLQTLV
jgi:RNA polymerase sigma-70 factor (ECF subfamily)